MCDALPGGGTSRVIMVMCDALPGGGTSRVIMVMALRFAALQASDAFPNWSWSQMEVR